VNIDYDSVQNGCDALTGSLRCGFMTIARLAKGGRRYGLCSLHLLLHNSELDRLPLPGDALTMERSAVLYGRAAGTPFVEAEAIGEVPAGALSLVLHFERVDKMSWFYVVAGQRMGWVSADQVSKIVRGDEA